MRGLFFFFGSVFVFVFVLFILFFFFKSKSTLHRIIAPNGDANKSTSPIKSLHTSFKPVLKCKKKVDNSNLKNIFKRSKFSKKKTLFFRILKIRCGVLLYSKNFFPVFKNWVRAVEDNQTTFFFPPNLTHNARLLCLPYMIPYGDSQDYFLIKPSWPWMAQYLCPVDLWFNLWCLSMIVTDVSSKTEVQEVFFLSQLGLRWRDLLEQCEVLLCYSG